MRASDMKSKTEKRRINIITTLINQLVTTVCGIIVPRVFIGAYGSGIYGMTVSITQFLSYISLLESGIGGVARGKLYNPLAYGDKQQISAIYHAIRRFFLYVSAIFTCYTFIIGFSYKDFAHIQNFSRGYIFTLVVVISLSTLAKYMGGLANLTIISADQKQYISNFIIGFTTIVNTLFIIVLVWLKCDIIWVKFGSSVIFVIRPLLYALYVKKHYRLPPEGKEKAKLEQKWTGIGQHIAFFLHTNTDVALLTLLADIKFVAVYSVYSLVISSIRAITESFTGGMEAAFGEAIAKNQTEYLRYLYRRYSILLMAVTTVLFGCTGILIVPFVKLYTKGITDVNYIEPEFALILLMSEAINCLALPCSSLPVAANHLRQTRWGAYGEAIINIAVSCLLISKTPLVGVALGTLVATTFRGIYYINYSSKKILEISADKNILALVGTIIYMCAVILLGRHIIEFAEIENYLQWIICGMVTFTAMVIPVGLFVYTKMKTLRDPSEEVKK